MFSSVLFPAQQRVKMMKILMVSHTCMSRTMGQPKARRLAEFSDIDLTVLVPDAMFAYGKWVTAEEPVDAHFRYVVGKTRWRNVMKQWYLQHYADSLSTLLKEFQPDVVDIWEEPWGLTCAQVVMLVRRFVPSAKIIVETEQNIYKRLPQPFLTFQNYTLKRADFCVARNSEAVDVLRRKRYQGSCAVVPNAVDIEMFRPAEPGEKAAVRASRQWAAADDFLIGYVGRLVPEKGVADILAALAKLPENAKLVFVGSGPSRRDLELSAEALHVSHRVIFAGSMPLSELPSAMRALDVLVLPSHTTPRWKEQFGRVLIEAGACAVPSIGSDSGAIPEVIADGGLIFPEGDPTALAQCIEVMMNNPERRLEYGRVAHHRAQQYFGWNHVAASMRNVYLRVLSGDMGSGGVAYHDNAVNSLAFKA
jgi:glycosyltransferase involved in cell wall biosynthesis